MVMIIMPELQVDACPVRFNGSWPLNSNSQSPTRLDLTQKFVSGLDAGPQPQDHGR